MNKNRKTRMCNFEVFGILVGGLVDEHRLGPRFGSR